jgi:hypothetical protein
MRKVLELAFGFMFACSAVWAQAISTAQINGTVQDATGLAVPGAEIKGDADGDRVGPCRHQRSRW